MTTCPKCGNQDYNTSRQCPQMNGAPVCQRCCTECCYYDPDPVGIYACRYHICNPKLDYKGELYKLDRQIGTKEKQIEYFYRISKPWIAEKIESELSWVRHQKTELERKWDEENQRAGTAT